MLNTITPVLITYNEAPNIARTLAKLTWARDVVIVDSVSTDRTREIADAAHPGIRWFERPFTTHAEQWNFALHETGITSDWVLALDADYVLSDEFVKELQSLQVEADVAGFASSFVYCINGQPLRGTVYPPVTVLYRRTAAHYEADGHSQRVVVNGRITPLMNRIFHDDRKPLSHWLASQVKYMRLEADKLHALPAGSLSIVDRVRQMIVVAPPAMFVYCLLGKGGLLDGRAGLFYALQRATAELILSLSLLDRRVNRGGR